MTTQRIKTSDAISGNASPELTGNKAASNAASKARSALEGILSLAFTGKLSDLKTSKERILAVADAIEQEVLVKDAIGFNMSYYREDDVSTGRMDKLGHACGTVACIAGWTMLLQEGPLYGKSSEDNDFGDNYSYIFHDKAAALFGLTDQQADELFLAEGSSFDRSLHDITGKQAIAVLKHLAETGDICWDDFNSDGTKKE